MGMRGVEVRIRHENDEPKEAVVLAEVPFTDRGLDEAIRLLQTWGVSIDGESFSEAWGGFVIEGGRAFFDVEVTP